MHVFHQMDLYYISHHYRTSFLLLCIHVSDFLLYDVVMKILIHEFPFRFLE